MKKPNKKPELTIEYVIQTLETDSCYYCAYGCEAPPSCEADCSYKDAVCKAIDYLKEYQERLQNLQDMMDRYDISVKNYEEAVENCRIAEQKYWRMTNNVEDMNPLTWDELKSMEGKPVWIEDGLKNGEWYIIECFTESGRFIAHDRYADDTVFKAIDMGNMWQAYRKERS